MVEYRTGAVVLGFLAFDVVDGVAELEGALALEEAAVVCEVLVLTGALEDDKTVEDWAVLETGDVLVELEGAAVVCDEHVVKGALEDEEADEVWQVLEADVVL